jgi:UDPglucose--hexose-1-phosphate uridylyltransferase
VKERRCDVFSDEWRTFATHRQDRTFLPGPEECPLCPAGRHNAYHEIPRTAYDIVVFDNRFPALTPDAPEPAPSTGLFRTERALGAAEVVLWSDDHSQRLSDLPVERLARVFDVWAERYAELGARSEVAYVMPFENKGKVVGVTLDHPHGQIYAYPEIPPRVRHLLEVGRRHFDATGRCLRCDVLAAEADAAVRIVAEDARTLAFVPYATRFPYEVHVQPRRHAPSLLDLSDSERASLASVLRQVLRAYDGRFGFSLPYVLALQQAPTDDGRWLEVSHLHIELTPLHRTATKLKYLAGSELAAGAFVNDLAPEDAAAELTGRRPPGEFGTQGPIGPQNKRPEPN